MADSILVLPHYCPTYVGFAVGRLFTISYDMAVRCIRGSIKVQFGCTALGDGCLEPSFALRDVEARLTKISDLGGLACCPVVENISFDVRGEPTVGSSEDVRRYFMCAEFGVLAVENCNLEESKRLESLKFDYRNESELD